MIKRWRTSLFRYRELMISFIIRLTSASKVKFSALRRSSLYCAGLNPSRRIRSSSFNGNSWSDKRKKYKYFDNMVDGISEARNYQFWKLLSKYPNPHRLSGEHQTLALRCCIWQNLNTFKKKLRNVLMNKRRFYDLSVKHVSTCFDVSHNGHTSSRRIQRIFFNFTLNWVSSDFMHRNSGLKRRYDACEILTK